MEDIHNWYRLIGLYIVLHIILFFVEWYKYKHSTLSWWGFKRHGMYFLSYFLLAIDILIVVSLIVLWALWPLVYNY
jgi:hypothetical protein